MGDSSLEPRNNELCSTHRCLNVPELQHIIFDIILHQPGGHATIAALARTSRRFLDVALDTLWCTQSSLVPLVKCFPQELWTVKRDIDGFRVFDLVSEPKPEDWARVKLYASRIRELTFDESVDMNDRYEGSLSGESFITLRKSLRSEPLLPNLHSFEWAQSLDDEAHDVASFLLMLNPQVSSMNVTMSQWDDNSAQTIASAIKEFGQNPTQLRSIHFAYPACLPVEEALLAVAFRQENLQSLVCSWENKMSFDTILHLSGLHNLREVSIKADQETTLQVVEKAQGLAGIFFPSLTLLSLYTDTTGLCDKWLGAIRSSALEHFTFVVEQPPTEAVLHDFIARLVQRQNRKLTKFAFYSNTPCARGNTQQHVVKPSTLEPLLPVDLRVLQVEPGAPVDVDDTFIERAANAWPRLRTLELGAEWRRHTPALAMRVSLQGLAPLARHCPNLRALGLAFNPNASAFEERFQAGDRPFDGVSFGLFSPFTLGVGSTSINPDDDIFLISGVLSDLCPGLRAVETAWQRAGDVDPVNDPALDEEDREVANRWREIDRFAVEMARVRRQERMWIM
ncbi:hypothetical protein C8Q79DRAFT_905700 [Trametes meyenii]|nr:hypothetical protein C8Q79DRAFT_905700 [Trametes meyenii]